MCFHDNPVRPTLDPICTNPCTGITALPGKTNAIIPINTAPPPAPATAVSSEVAADKRTKPKNKASLTMALLLPGNLICADQDQNGIIRAILNRAPDLRSGPLKKVT
tara:strand:+ start:8236 stop:8556 length:321 start_codon:yes stop_codon:yes gene_type:complete